MQNYSFSYTLPSSQHYLSYDDCLEDKKENYQNFSVLCCVCAQWCAHTHEQFLKMSVGLGLDLFFVHLGEEIYGIWGGGLQTKR